MKDLNLLAQIVKGLITGKSKHKHYTHVVSLAKEFKAYATGEGIAEYLKRFTPREDEEAFKQRIDLTVPITSEIFGTLESPFIKAVRNNTATFKYKLNDKAKEEVIEKMIKTFYSVNKHGEENTINTWIKEVFMSQIFVDPNSFVAIEWEGKELTEVLEPRPFFIPSSDALNFEYDGTSLKWLFVQRSIQFDAYDKVKKTVTKKEGIKYIYYSEGYTVVAKQCCEHYVQQFGIETVQDNTANNLGLWKEGEINYIIDIYETKLDFIPAYRIGYLRDRAKNNETFVSPLHLVKPTFLKSLRRASEFDLTIIKHCFPQQYMYTEVCQGGTNGEESWSCDSGYIEGTRNKCPSCKGTGRNNNITSAQENMILPLPGDQEEMLDLSKLMYYHEPPVALMEFQKKCVDELGEHAHSVLFQSTMFMPRSSNIAKTATEVDGNFDAIYDRIEPMTEQISKLIVQFVNAFFHLAGLSEDQISNATLVHAYPADLKVKGVSILLNDLKTANDSNAPSFLIAEITKEIASVTFSSSPEKMKEFEVKSLFFPFSGKSQEEIMLATSSPYVSEKDKYLYFNFERIFKEIEMQHKGFYLMGFEAQYKIVTDKLEEFIKEADEKRPSFQVDTKLFIEDYNGEGKDGEEEQEPEV